MTKLNLHLILSFLITIILFNSCEKRKIENCANDIIGTYDLLSDCSGDPSNDYLGVVSEGSGDEDGSISVAVYDLTIEGYINDKDCNITFNKNSIEYYTDPDYYYEIIISGTGFFDPETGDLLCQLIISYSYNAPVDPTDNEYCNLSFRKQ